MKQAVLRDPRLLTPALDPRDRIPLARVGQLYVRPAEGAPVRGVRGATLVAGRGIEEDYYFHKLDPHSPTHDPGDELTLISREAINRVQIELDLPLADGQHRRQIVLNGIPPEALVKLIGRRFTLGGAVCEGVADCTPCAYLQKKLAVKGLVKAFLKTGGLRARVVQGGLVALGDTLEVAEHSPLAAA